MNAVIVVAYIAVMLAVSIVSLRKVKSLSAFFVADRGAGPWLVTASLLSTIIGGSATLGMAGLGYSQGLTGAWWMLSGVIGLVLLGLFFAGRVRELAVYTLPEILERQYGSRTLKLIASLLIAVAWTGIITGQIIAAGKILSVMWPGHSELAIILSGAAFTLYIAISGQHSVLKTDLVQFVVIVVGLVVCLLFVMPAGGGLAATMASLPAGHGAFPVSSEFPLGALVSFLFFVGMPYLVGPDIYTRLLSAKDSRTARNSVFISAAVLLPFAFAVTAIGMFASVLLPGIPAETAFPALVMKTLPEGFNGLVLAAIFAAVIPSTSLMTVGTILTWDVFRPLAGIDREDRRLVWVSRAVLCAVGAICIFMALRLQGIISSLMLTYTVFSSGIVIPILFGFYSRRLRLNAAGAIAAVLCGGCLGLGLKLAGFKDLVLVSLPVSAVVLFAVSWSWNRLFPRGLNADGGGVS